MVSPINEYALEDNTVFSIEGKGLKLNTSEDVQAFVDTIVQMDDLQIIRLSGNTIGVEAGKALASALQSRNNIKVYKYTSRFSFSSLYILYLPSCLWCTLSYLSRRSLANINISFADPIIIY